MVYSLLARVSISAPFDVGARCRYITVKPTQTIEDVTLLDVVCPKRLKY